MLLVFGRCWDPVSVGTPTVLTECFVVFYTDCADICVSWFSTPTVLTELFRGFLHRLSSRSCSVVFYTDCPHGMFRGFLRRLSSRNVSWFSQSLKAECEGDPLRKSQPLADTTFSVSYHPVIQYFVL
jgi:hypothetical protein